MTRHFFAGFLALAVCGCRTVDYQLLEAGHSTPDTLYLAEHVAELEQMTPHTGMSLDIHWPRETANSLAIEKWQDRANVNAFRPVRLTDEMVAAGIADMDRARSDKFRHNYIGLVTYTKPERAGMDWFDDEWWATILHNTRVIARAARQGGCQGIVLDAEEYAGVCMWDYAKLLEMGLVHGADRAATMAAAKDRGRAFAAALCDEFPGITVWTFFAYSAIVTCKEDPEYAERAGGLDLYLAFLDGMLEGSDDDFILVDGQESSYGYTTRKELEAGARAIRVDALKYTSVDPGLYRAKVRVGFGFYIDASAYKGFSWNRLHAEKNYFTPSRLQRVVYHAFRVGDGYVWTWSEKPSWWVDGPYGKPHPPAKLRPSQAGVPQAYKYALWAAFHSPGSDRSVPVLTEPDPAEARYVRFPELKPDPENPQGGEVTIPDSMQPLAQLPAAGWRFRIDPYERGDLEKWYLPSTDVTGELWRDIRIGEIFESQGVDFDGVVWYRRDIEVPDLPEGKRIYLFFGAVDESVWCYIDGELVAYHDGDGNEIWNMPFALDVTGALPANRTVRVVFRCLDRFRVGGIWKPVWITAEK